MPTASRSPDSHDLDGAVATLSGGAPMFEPLGALRDGFDVHPVTSPRATLLTILLVATEPRGPGRRRC